MKLLLILVPLLGLSSACKSPCSGDLQLSPPAIPQVPVQLAVDEILTLRLRENITTDVRWTFEELDESLLEVTEDRYVADSEFLPVSNRGGERSICLRAMAPGRAKVILRHGDEPYVRERMTFAVEIGPR